jgi:two-component system, NtrC family, sensor kinase
LATATLLVLQGIDQGKRVHLGEGTATVGRSPQNTVPILDTEVSRHHAEFRSQNGLWTLADLESSNGTFVNGESVRSQKLTHGDQIQIGRTVLLFTVEDPADSAITIADHIDLLEPDTPDRSAIVSTVTPAEGKSLARQATVARLGPMVSADANLRTLYRISEEAARATDSLDSLLDRVLGLTIDAVGADRACMLIAESKSDRILPRVFRHRTGVRRGGRMPISTTIVNYVINSGEGVWTSDAQHDDRFETGNSIVQAGIREAMCVPMHGRYELMGVIYVDITTSSDELLSGGRARRFSEELLALLLAIGRQSAMAVENFRYQQALVTAERLAAVGQAIASLSHDVKNILQGIRGGSYLIDMGLNNKQEEMIRRGWTIVERNQERIYNLVMDMLTFSKERQPKLAEADLNQLVSDVAELLRGRTAEASPVCIETQLAEDLPTSIFDADGILRAVLNIGSNAVDAVEDTDQPRVVLSTAYDAGEDEVLVSVTDNGPGIPEEELSKVFDLFASSKGSRGTGLGLAVSRKILLEHGGGISVTCPEAGGCRFEIRWPRIVDGEPDVTIAADDADGARA